MPNSHRNLRCNALGAPRSVASQCYDQFGLQQIKQISEHFLSRRSFIGTVWPVAEGNARFMRMKGKKIPKENGKIDFVED
jgi:hypothetical protein